jgi:ATP-dependent DNA ligase
MGITKNAIFALAVAARYEPTMLRILAAGFVAPCLPTKAQQPPSGEAWLHEIKHDGFRMLVRRDAAGVRLFTRNGHDWTWRFPLIASAALSLKARCCLIDGEAARRWVGRPLLFPFCALCRVI